MPVVYQIDKIQRIIRTKCVGYVTLDEVVDHFRVLEQDPDCQEPLDVLLDLTETTSLPGSRELRVVSQELNRIRPSIRFEACAIVTDRPALFGMARMFEVFAAGYFRVTRVFRALCEAEAWLNSQQPQDQSPA
jgi:hypothetical protein